MIGTVIALGNAIFVMARGAKINEYQSIELGEKVVGYTKQFEKMQELKVCFCAFDIHYRMHYSA